MYEPETIEQAISPISWLNLLFGMGIFDTKPNCSTKLLKYAFSIIISLQCIILKIVCHKFSQYYEYDNYRIYREMFVISSYVTTFITIVLMVTSWTNLQTLQKVIELIELCEEKMQYINLPKGYRKLFIYQIKSITFCAFYFFLFTITYLNSSVKKSIPSIMKLFLLYIDGTNFILFWVCNISFCCWIKYFTIKFQQINQLLRSMLPTTLDTSQHEKTLMTRHDFKEKKFRNKNTNANTMRAIKQIHLELTKIARTMNTYYGRHILLTVAFSVVWLTGALYCLYKIVLSNITIRDILINGTFVSFFAFLHLWHVTYVSHVCETASTEAANVGSIICKLYEPSTSEEFRSEIQDFTLQLIQNPLEFTAYGFFNLDYSFIQEVMGSVATYLIIMIQVGDITANRNSVENEFPSPMDYYEE